MPDYTISLFQKRKRKKRRKLNIHKLRLQTAQTPKQLKKKLDTYFANHIRRMYKECCTPDGKCGGPIQAGHLITRGALRTRWDERNCFGQCRNHNLLHEYRPEIMTQWYISRFGLEKYKELVSLSRQIWRPTKQELLDLIAKYEAGDKSLDTI